MIRMLYLFSLTILYTLNCNGQENRNNSNTVSVIINGEPTDNFVFDTGADCFIQMPEKKVKDLIKRGILFEKHILKKEKTVANAQGTKFKTKTIEAKEVQFGDTHLGWTEINYFKDAPYLLGNSIIKKGNFLFVGGEYYEIIDIRKNKSDLDIKKTGTYYNSLNIINKTIESNNKNRNIESFYVDSNSFMLDFRDTTFYKTVNINGIIWMAENLSYGNIDEPGIWVYENDMSNKSKYGYLYSYNVAKYVCPTGWHLPTTNELKKTFLDNKPKKPDKLIPLSKESDEYYEKLTKYFRTLKNEDYPWYCKEYLRTSDGYIDWDNYSIKKEEINDRDYNLGLNLVPSGRMDLDHKDGFIFNNQKGSRDVFWGWKKNGVFYLNTYYEEFGIPDNYNCGIAVRCIKDY